MKIAGFTLIELLIVIAIILILIAIALPNFLEAQLRAKIARVEGDLRTISTALETYFIDWQTYPDDSEDEFTPGAQGLLQLTTPLKYLSELPFDVFVGGSGRGVRDGVPVFFEMASTGLRPGMLALGRKTNPFGVHAFALYSHGPNVIDDFSSEQIWPFGGPSDPCASGSPLTISYSPTNGSRSRGNIHSFGGQFRSGHWCLDGVAIKGRGFDFRAND